MGRRNRNRNRSGQKAVANGPLEPLPAIPSPAEARVETEPQCEDKPGLTEEVYLEERKFYDQVEGKSADTLDKNLIFLASGALVLSLGFIEKIASDPPRFMWALALSWVGFGAALLTSVYSQLTAQYTFRRRRDLLEIDWCQQNGWEVHDVEWSRFERFLFQVTKTTAKSPWSGIATRLNQIAFGALVFGIVFLMVFAYPNLSHRKGPSDVPAATEATEAAEAARREARPG